MTSTRKSLLPSSDPRARPIFGRSVVTRLRNYLMAGIVVSAPALVTFWVFHRFFLSLDGVLELLPDSWEAGGRNLKELLTSVPGLGAVLTLLCVVAVGFLATNLVGRRVLKISEEVIKRLPVLSTIYGSVKQLLEAVFSSDGSRFSEVVYVEYPRAGLWSIAFVTGPAFAGADERLGRPCVSLFIPTTPNPTSGFYILAPKEDVVPSGLTVEQAFKLIMSAGIVGPDSAPAA